MANALIENGIYRDETNKGILVDIVGGSSSGPTDTDDGSLAAAQTVALSSALNYGFDGVAWERITSTSNALDVNIASGSSAGPAETEDGSIAAGQNAARNMGLLYGFGGITWERITSTSNALDVGIVTALPAGTNNIGDVDIASALPAGTNAIGKLAANSGVDIGDVDVTSLTNSAINGPGEPTIDSITQAALNVAAAATDSVLVASAPNKQIWVYSIMVTSNVAGTISIQDEDNVAITGVVQVGDTGGYSVAPSGNFAMPIWKLGTDKDLEMDTVTCEVDGYLTYALVSI